MLVYTVMRSSGFYYAKKKIRSKIKTHALRSASCIAITIGSS